MANPAVTYTLTNGQTADASQVMQNFNDIINALTDGTKSLSIDALTCAGAASFQGNVTLGNGSVDDITFSGSMASSLPIKTNNSFDVGSSTLGLAGAYFGAPSSRTIRIRANQSLAASYSLILPGTAGSSGDYMESDGTGGLSFVPVRRGPATASNYGLSASVGSNQLTVTMLGGDGSALSSSNPAHVVGRSSTAATGTPTVNVITSAPTSIVVPNGATLGHVAAQDQFVYVYIIFGTATEIAVSGQPFLDEMSLQNATAVTSGSTSPVTLYATSNHTAKPVRYLGRLKSNQTVAGTWASVMTEIALNARPERQPRSEVFLTLGNGHGSGATKIRRFTTTIKNIGTAITYADSSTNGATFTINEDGVYSIYFQDAQNQTIGNSGHGVSVDSSQTTTSIGGITNANRLGWINNNGSNNVAALSIGEVFLSAGQVIRAHTVGHTPTSEADSTTAFRITQTSK